MPSFVPVPTKNLLLRRTLSKLPTRSGVGKNLLVFLKNILEVKLLPDIMKNKV